MREAARNEAPLSTDTEPAPPLARYQGAAPPAPRWFREAVDTPHERHRLRVEGAQIEWLAWGQRGRPGLLLLHGSGAHADWWRFIAPFFADTHRVATLSWGGMGNSDHRARYRMDLFVEELLAVAAAAGLSEAGPFTCVGHSFGGFPMMALANRPAQPIGHAIILDTPFDPKQRRPRSTGSETRPHTVYASEAQALARFRWIPPQPTTHDYIADFIARLSIRPSDGGPNPGFSWKFDPFLWREFEPQPGGDPLAAPGCPVSFIWGEQSALVHRGVVDDMARRLPPATRLVPIPHAHHHVMADQPLALVSALRALLA